MDRQLKRSEKGQYVARDLSGERFGRLIVLEKTGEKKHGYAMWSAVCDCGNAVTRPSYSFIRGLQSCGCAPKGRPRIPNNGAHVNALYAHRKHDAKIRGLEFSLTKYQARILFESPCTYCGAKPTVTVTHPNLSGEYAWNGIDRANNSIGYTPENSVPCCWECNHAKGSRNADDFLAWVARVSSHVKSKP